MTPSLTTGDVLFSLTGYVAGLCRSSRLRHLLHLPAAARRAGRARTEAIPNATASRPLAFADTAASATGSQRRARSDRDGAQPLWPCSGPASIAVAILVYVILDGFDLGVGILFGTTRDEAMRGQMMAAIAPFWDGNETWLVIIGASLFARLPGGLCGVSAAPSTCRCCCCCSG